MSRYETYKSTDVEWVNSVPKHWQVTKLKLIGNFTSSGIDKLILEDEGSVKMVNYMDVYGNKNCIINSSFDFMVVTCPDSKREVHNVIKGDLIFTPSSETIEDIGLSALIDEDLVNTVYSYHVLRFRFTKKLVHKFKKYLCNNFYVLSQFSSNAKGTTRQILSREEFKNTVVFIPTPAEQLAIANYLDDQTQKIDRLIANKKAQVEKLKELRQIEINNAVTKGLNPNAEMKESGIEWLGKIPKHWAVKRLKNVSMVISKGTTPSTMGEDLDETGNIRFIKAENIFNNSLQPYPEFYISEYTDEILFRSRLEEGDILIVIAGATIGKVAIVTKEFLPSNTNQAVSFIRLNLHRVTKEYIFYLLQTSLINQLIWLDAVVSAQPNLSMTNLGLFPVMLPPLKEQAEIANYLQQRTTAIDQLIKNIEAQIEKLQELRKIKIYEAVTGKIKVNAYAETTA